MRLFFLLQILAQCSSALRLKVNDAERDQGGLLMPLSKFEEARLDSLVDVSHSTRNNVSAAVNMTAIGIAPPGLKSLFNLTISEMAHATAALARVQKRVENLYNRTIAMESERNVTFAALPTLEQFLTATSYNTTMLVEPTVGVAVVNSTAARGQFLKTLMQNVTDTAKGMKIELPREMAEIAAEIEGASNATSTEGSETTANTLASASDENRVGAEATNNATNNAAEELIANATANMNKTEPEQNVTMRMIALNTTLLTKGLEIKQMFKDFAKLEKHLQTTTFRNEVNSGMSAAFTDAFRFMNDMFGKLLERENKISAEEVKEDKQMKAEMKKLG